jgi:hypothetical protein
MALLSTRIAAPLIAPMLGLLALGACTVDRTRYPSLAVRPAERAYASGQTAPPTPGLHLMTQVRQGLPMGSDLATRVGALRQTALSAHARFTEQQGTAARLAQSAQGASPGTEAWSQATIALASLVSARSEGMIAMADLDRLFIAATEAAALGQGTDLQTVTPAYRELEVLLAEEDRAIATLTDRLGG